MDFYLILIVLGCSCFATRNKSEVLKNYDKMYSYVSYPKGGSTSSIFYHLTSNDNEKQRREISVVNVELINALLKELNSHKHRQRKIASIAHALEMWRGMDKEIFIIYNKNLVNLTTRIEYDLNQSQFDSLNKILTIR